MKSKILILLLMASVISSCTQSSTQSSTSTDAQTTKTPQVNNLEEDIQFIRNKYKIISEARDYKTIPFEAQCDERSSVTLERKYNPKGELSYLKYEECGEHGCSIKHHYYWEGKLIFLFQKNDYTPGSSHHIQEFRTYLKNGKMIQCLEKEARYYEGQAPMAELLKNAKNKVVDCKPEKLTTNLSEIETISLEEAQKYFCP